MQGAYEAEQSVNQAKLALEHADAQRDLSHAQLAATRTSAGTAAANALQAETDARQLHEDGALKAATSQEIIAVQMHSKARELHEDAARLAIECESLGAESAATAARLSAAEANLSKLHQDAKLLLSITDALSRAQCTQDKSLALCTKHLQTTIDMNAADELAAVAAKQAQLLQQQERCACSEQLSEQQQRQQRQQLANEIEAAHQQNAQHVRSKQSLQQSVEQLQAQMQRQDGLLHVQLQLLSTVLAQQDATCCIEELSAASAQAGASLSNLQASLADQHKLLHRHQAEHSRPLPHCNAAHSNAHSSEATEDGDSDSHKAADAVNALKASIEDTQQDMQAASAHAKQAAEQEREARSCVQQLTNIAAALQEAVDHQHIALSSDELSTAGDWQSVHLDAPDSFIPGVVVLTRSAALAATEASLRQDALAASTAVSSMCTELAGTEVQLGALQAAHASRELQVADAQQALSDACQRLAESVLSAAHGCSQDLQQTSVHKESIDKCQTTLDSACQSISSCDAETAKLLRVQKRLQGQLDAASTQAKCCAQHADAYAQLHQLHISAQEARRTASADCSAAPSDEATMELLEQSLKRLASIQRQVSLLQGEPAHSHQDLSSSPTQVRACASLGTQTMLCRTVRMSARWCAQLRFSSSS